MNGFETIVLTLAGMCFAALLGAGLGLLQAFLDEDA
jgi:ABC-type Fe3+-siderophore transport system permease subunit